MTHNKRTPFRTKLEAIANSPKGRMTKGELIQRANVILEKVEDAIHLRQQENAKANRDEDIDELLAILDLIETRVLELGALPSPKFRR